MRIEGIHDGFRTGQNGAVSGLIRRLVSEGLFIQLGGSLEEPLAHPTEPRGARPYHGCPGHHGCPVSRKGIHDEKVIHGGPPPSPMQRRHANAE
jgi:hypothetical protein